MSLAWAKTSLGLSEPYTVDDLVAKIWLICFRPPRWFQAQLNTNYPGASAGVTSAIDDLIRLGNRAVSRLQHDQLDETTALILREIVKRWVSLGRYYNAHSELLPANVIEQLRNCTKAAMACYVLLDAYAIDNHTMAEAAADAAAAVQ